MAISAWGRVRDWRRAVELLSEMRERWLTPDVITYSAAISACEKGSQWERALELLSEMRERELTPNVITYNAAISACEKGSQWERALELLSEMRQRELEPNVITYSAAISACEKGSQWERALELLSEVRERGLKPNVITYSAAISACEKGSQCLRALELLSEMRERGLEPNVITYNAAISACRTGPHLTEALQLLKEMAGAGVEADERTFTVAIAACAKHASHQPNYVKRTTWATVMDLITAAKTAQKCDIVTYAAMLEACLHCYVDDEPGDDEQSDAWEDVERLLIEDGLRPCDVLQMFANVCNSFCVADTADTRPNTLEEFHGLHVLIAAGVETGDTPLQYLFEEVHNAVKTLGCGRASRAFRLHVCDTMRDFTAELNMGRVDMIHVLGHGIKGRGRIRSKVTLPGGGLTAHAIAKLLKQAAATERPVSLVYLDCCDSDGVLDDLRANHADVARSAAWITWTTEASDYAAYLLSRGIYASLAASQRLDHPAIRSAFESGKKEMVAEYAIGAPSGNADDNRGTGGLGATGTKDNDGMMVAAGGIPSLFMFSETETVVDESASA